MRGVITKRVSGLRGYRKVLGAVENAPHPVAEGVPTDCDSNHSDKMSSGMVKAVMVLRLMRKPQSAIIIEATSGRLLVDHSQSEDGFHRVQIAEDLKLW